MATPKRTRHELTTAEGPVAIHLVTSAAGGAPVVLVLGGPTDAQVRLEARLARAGFAVASPIGDPANFGAAALAELAAAALRLASAPVLGAVLPPGAPPEVAARLRRQPGVVVLAEWPTGDDALDETVRSLVRGLP